MPGRSTARRNIHKHMTDSEETLLHGSSEHVAGCFERSKRQQEEKTREKRVDENAVRGVHRGPLDEAHDQETEKEKGR